MPHMPKKLDINRFFSAATCRISLGIPPLLHKLIAGLILTLISPLIFCVMVLVRLESRGPVFFSQNRVGRRGRRFRFYKFRSMYHKSDVRYVDPQTLESDREGVCIKLHDDPRVTRIGRVIRKYSIDELPQLFNVLRGDMLLIGPRPALCVETDQYSRSAMRRLNIEPGLTGLWQVSGRADTSFEEQVDLDVRYMKEKTLWMDIMILLQTIPAVLSGRGAY